MRRTMMAAALTAALSSAQAEPYALVGLGPAAEVKALGVSDPTVPTWIGAGYRAGGWALEAAYIRLGTVEQRVSTGTSTLSTHSWTGSGPGAFAVRHFNSFLVRAGAYRLHSTSDGEESRVWAPSLAVGWQTVLGQRVTARLSLEYVRGKGDFDNARIGGFSLLYGL
jgi:hypothetical protein